MFNKHPKGLIAAALANLGERFGFYTMMAILVLFLQAKFGMNGKEAGFIYSTFYFSIYILALVGGIIADKTRNYKGTIFTGIVLMAVGYLLLAIPSKTPVDNKMLYLVITCASLFSPLELLFFFPGLLLFFSDLLLVIYLFQCFTK